MGAPRGHKKHGGRQKGTPNKTNQELIERCRMRGVDPFDVMLNLLADEQTNEGLKFAAAKELCQYVYPKRKSLELDVNMELARQAEEFAKLPKQEQIKLAKAEVKRLEGE